MKEPSYLDLADADAQSEAFDASLALPKTGFYTLSKNMVINRLAGDTKNCNFLLDLQGHTLTSLGRAGAQAIYFRGGGDGSSMTFTNGTVVVPASPYQGYALVANYITMNRNQDGVPTNVALVVTGENTSLTAPKIQLTAGKDNRLCVENGATLETELEFGGGDHLVVRIDGGTFMTKGVGKVLSIGTAASVSNEFVLANGGVLGNMDMHRFDIGKAAGALAAHLVLEGAETVVSITNRPTIGQVAGADGCGFRVEKGATLKFVEDAAANYGRFWMQNASEIHVAGAGSKLVTEAAFPAICGNNSYAKGCVVRVTDNALADFNAFTLGSNAGCNGNRAFVDGGAELKVRTSMNIGGQVNDDQWEGEAPCASNRVVVGEGGTLTVLTHCYVGARSRSKDNALVVDGASARAVVGTTLYLGVKDSANANRLVIANGGVVTSSIVRVCSTSSCMKLSGGRLVTQWLEFNGPTPKLSFEFPTAVATPEPLIDVTESAVTLRDDTVVAVAAPVALSRAVEKVVLIRSAGALTIPEAPLTVLRASAPEGFRLYKSANEVGYKRTKGMALILK